LLAREKIELENRQRKGEKIIKKEESKRFWKELGAKKRVEKDGFEINDLQVKRQLTMGLRELKW